MINIEEIRPGDLVTIQDGARNVAVGEAEYADGELSVCAFGQRIRFGRFTAQGTWTATDGVRVVGHIPSLVA